jgi:hypothetical protein
VRLGEDNLQFDGEEGSTAVLRIKNLLEFDRFQVFGPGNEATHLSLVTTYRRLPGKPTRVVPLTNDPLSPYNWAGTIWEATAKGTFSAAYDDGTFSVTGTMDSAVATEGTPGHIGRERNGVFARPRHRDATSSLLSGDGTGMPPRLDFFVGRTSGKGQARGLRGSTGWRPAGRPY